MLFLAAELGMKKTEQVYSNNRLQLDITIAFHSYSMTIGEFQLSESIE